MRIKFRHNLFVNYLDRCGFAGSSASFCASRGSSITCRSQDFLLRSSQSVINLLLAEGTALRTTGVQHPRRNFGGDLLSRKLELDRAIRLGRDDELRVGRCGGWFGCRCGVCLRDDRTGRIVASGLRRNADREQSDDGEDEEHLFEHVRVH